MDIKYSKAEECEIKMIDILNTMDKIFYKYKGKDETEDFTLYASPLEIYADTNYIWKEHPAYIYCRDTKVFIEVSIISVKLVRSFFGIKRKFKKNDYTFSGEYVAPNGKSYHINMDTIQGFKNDEIRIDLPFKPHSFDPFYFSLPKHIYKEYLDRFLSDGSLYRFSGEAKNTLEKELELYKDTFTPDNYKFLSMLLESKNIEKILMVNNRKACKHLLVKIVIDTRTSTYKVEWKGKNLAKISKYNYDLAKFVFGELDTVPIWIKEENFAPDRQSHRWSHIKNDPTSMEKLQGYLGSTKYTPKDNVFYYIKSSKSNNGTTTYFLERDVIMSPRKKKKKGKNYDNKTNKKNKI